MPILLDEDRRLPLPKMHRVKQIFPKESLQDIEAALRQQLQKQEIRAKLKPGSKVAIAVGSRGIKNLALIVKTLITCLKEAGCLPYIVAAMGSHGSGTEQGQLKLLASYGISQETMGVEVIAKTDVIKLDDIHFSKSAMQADLIIPVNRIKIHTDFNADIGSGLCKMLVIGLGNHIGCSTIHEHGFENFGKILPKAAGIILKKAPVGFGIAVVENAYDETALIEAVPAEHLISREKKLLKISLANMPTLMIPEIDVLIVEEIGKNISGAGFDPHILGKSFLLKTFALPVPRIERMVLNNISEQSHGNALGMGVFDVITRKVFDKLDLEAIYANAIASKCTDDAKIPIIAADEEEALRIAIKITNSADRHNLKIVKIKNTLELEEIAVSEALVPWVNGHEKLFIF